MNTVDFKRWVKKFMALGFNVESISDTSAVISSLSEYHIYNLTDTGIRKSGAYSYAQVIRSNNLNLVLASPMNKGAANDYTFILDESGKSHKVVIGGIKDIKAIPKDNEIVILCPRKILIGYRVGNKMEIFSATRNTLLVNDGACKEYKLPNGDVLVRVILTLGEYYFILKFEGNTGCKEIHRWENVKVVLKCYGSCNTAYVKYAEPVITKDYIILNFIAYLLNNKQDESYKKFSEYYRFNKSNNEYIYEKVVEI